jgi:hypothetical protein
MLGRVNLSRVLKKGLACWKARNDEAHLEVFLSSEKNREKASGFADKQKKSTGYTTPRHNRVKQTEARQERIRRKQDVTQDIC